MNRARVQGVLAAACVALFSAEVSADEDFRSAAPPARRASAFKTPSAIEARLANGTRVVIVERHELPLISVHVVSDIGAASAPPGVAGLAANMATRGVSGATFLDGARELSSGVRVDTNVGPARVEIVANMLATRFANAVAYVGDVALRPAWDPDTFARVKKRQLEDRRRNWDLGELAYESVYPAPHPLHVGIWGGESAVASASLDQLRAYWRAAFSVGHVTLVVVGDVIPAPTVALLESAFGSLPPPTIAPTALAPLGAPPTRKSAVVRPSHGSQSEIVVACAAPSRTSPDYYPMRILDEIIGGGMASRLFASTRDAHGYTYGLSSTLYARNDGGIFFIHGSVDVDRTGEAVGAILVELAHVSSDTFPEADLARAKEHLIHRIPGKFETAEGTASELAQLVVLHLPLDDFDRVPERVRAVTSEQVAAVAKLYADPTRAQITVVGETGDVRAQLTALSILPLEERAR